MADTPEQAALRESLRSRGEQLAPRVSEGSQRQSKPSPERAKKTSPAKKAVKGAVEKGTPPGRAYSMTVQRTRRGGAGRAARPGGPEGATAPRATTRGKQQTRGQRAGRGAKRVYGTLTGRASGGVLLAEFAVGAVIISLGMFTKGTTKGYTATMSEIMIRLTALTMVFFILFLMAGSPNAGKFAAWLGALVDLGILFTAYRESFFSTLTDIVQGKPLGVEEVTLTAATKMSDTPPTGFEDE